MHKLLVLHNHFATGTRSGVADTARPSIMGVAKFTPTKKIAAECVRNRKHYQSPTPKLFKASRAEEVRAKLERLEEMLTSFEQEVLKRGFEGVGQALMWEAQIAELDNDIESLIGELYKKILDLRASKEVSCAKTYEFRKRLSRLEDRYIDSACFGNDL